jgi:GAF domain-containing protein
MKTHFSHTFINAVLRLADAPQHTLSKVAALVRGDVVSAPTTGTTPEHVVRRLENVFEALGELSAQPDLVSALDLACDTLHAELPNAATAAGLYDIDADAIRVIAARGLEHDLLRGTVLPRARCFGGSSAEEPVVVSGHAGGADWIGQGETGSIVLLCPIVHDANLLGVLALAEPLCAADFSRDDVELVSYVAEQLAGVIQSRRVTTAAAHAHAQRVDRPSNV